MATSCLPLPDVRSGHVCAADSLPFLFSTRVIPYGSLVRFINSLPFSASSLLFNQFHSLVLSTCLNSLPFSTSFILCHFPLVLFSAIFTWVILYGSLYEIYKIICRFSASLLLYEFPPVLFSGAFYRCKKFYTSFILWHFLLVFFCAIYELVYSLVFSTSFNLLHWLPVLFSAKFHVAFCAYICLVSALTVVSTLQTMEKLRITRLPITFLCCMLHYVKVCCMFDVVLRCSAPVRPEINEQEQLQRTQSARYPERAPERKF